MGRSFLLSLYGLLLLLVGRVHHLEGVCLTQNLLHVGDDTHRGVVVCLDRDGVEWLICFWQFATLFHHEIVHLRSLDNLVVQLNTV